ncbi:MAG: cytochrome c3 family protein [Deltaproteobacteria bacterium]|nr:cytochrome c3 family protein [Deltaproteobacteria bacterium]
MKPIRAKTILGAALVAVLALVSLTPAWGRDQAPPPVVSDSAFDHHRRRAAPFAHDEHNDLAAIEDCALCHHVVENGRVKEDEDSVGMECSECHGSGLPLIAAYHGRCKECHQETGLGPILCATCHTVPR